MRNPLLAVLLVLPALAGCTDAGDENPRVLFETSLGDFTVELWPDEAPKTVENFLHYVHDGHFDGLTFHRIAPDFVVQGGGYLPDHSTLRPTRAPVVNEAQEDVKNEKWTLSMARTPSPDSATSQFFINLKDNPSLDKNAGSAGYAVFGEVVSGFGTIENMTEVEPGQSFSAGGFFPKEPIVIEKATQVAGNEPESLPAADVHVELVTPGTWNVTHTDEVILAYAENTGGRSADVAWSLTGADGGDLPDGWNATFDDATHRVPGGGAVHTLVHLTVPAGTSGDFDLILHGGDATTPVTAHVELVHDRISREGDTVTAAYAGTCTDDGEAFDDGQFDLTLGGGRAVAGFDLGLVGLGQDEPATLVLPAALAYGRTDGPCTETETAGLTFEVSIVAFSE